MIDLFLFYSPTGHISDFFSTCQRWLKKNYQPLCRVVIITDIIGVETHCKGSKTMQTSVIVGKFSQLIYTSVCARDRERKRESE